MKSTINRYVDARQHWLFVPPAEQGGLMMDEAEITTNVRAAITHSANEHYCCKTYVWNSAAKMLNYCQLFTRKGVPRSWNAQSSQGIARANKRFAHDVREALMNIIAPSHTQIGMFSCKWRYSSSWGFCLMSSGSSVNRCLTFPLYFILSNDLSV